MDVNFAVTLRKEHIFLGFENRVLRRTFGPKREEVRAIGGWRQLHNEELHNLYSFPNIRMRKSRRMSWAGHVVRMGAKSYAYKLLVGKP
jgi:hypothetical protein